MENVMEKFESHDNISQIHSVAIHECRVCLKPCNEYWNLFENDEDIPRKIMAFASIQIEDGDGLPTVICFSCRQLLDMSYDFKCQVEKSDAALRKILLTRINMNQDNAKELLSQSINDVITEAIADEIPSNQIEIKEFEIPSESKEHTLQEIKHVFNDYNEKEDSVAYNIGEDCISGNESMHEEETEGKTEGIESEDNKLADKDEDLSEPEMISALENTEILLEDQGVTVGKLIDETDQIMESEPMKQEELSLREESEMSEGENNQQTEKMIFHCDDLKFELKDNLLSEGEDEADEVSSESSKLKVTNCQNLIDDLNDSDEEKPLISRTNRQKCPHCIKSFATNIALQRHMAVHKHKTKLRYVCYLCDKQFSNVAKLKNHVSSNHDSLKSDKKVDVDNNYSKLEADDTVEKSDKDIGGSIDKQKAEKKNYKLKCKACAKQFTYQKSFLSHIKTHPEYERSEASDNHSEQLETIEETPEHQNDSSNSKINESDDDDLPLEGLQCTQCGKLFATKGNLKRHISTHSGLRFNCSTCGKEFSRLDKLKDHEQSKHKEEIFGPSDDEDEDTDNEGKPSDGTESRRKEKKCRPHQCAMCPKAFAQAQSLANHMERHKRIKEPQKRFLCEVCSKCFAQSGSLVAHMRTHTGVKPYVCNVCSRAFTKSTYLQLHLRTHSGEKPYICQYCSRAFARANTLARHITMHTGEAKYHCQICMKSFRRLTSLNEHTYTHTGQRPYACKICSKRYNNAGSLYAHTKKCRAQQLSGSAPSYTVSVDNANHHDTGAVPQMLIYTQRKIAASEPQPTQVGPTPQFMITTVQSQKSLPANISQPFAVGDPHFYAIDGKQFKNPYYTIYPNM